MAFPSSDSILADPGGWVLILHTLFASGQWHTLTLSPYPTIDRCEQAARAYDSAMGITVHYGREGEGGDPELVTRAIAVCLPGPGGPRINR